MRRKSHIIMEVVHFVCRLNELRTSRNEMYTIYDIRMRMHVDPYNKSVFYQLI